MAASRSKPKANAKRPGQPARAAQPAQKEPRPRLPGVLEEFRSALELELEAAKSAARQSGVPLRDGRRIGSQGGESQYAFQAESVLSLPDDSPGELILGDGRQVEAVIVSVEGLTITVSVKEDLGGFVGSARLVSDLTFLLRKLIARIEARANTPNLAGDRMLGIAPVAGEAESFLTDALNAEQLAAVQSGLGRNLTFIWGPPGTGKTHTIGALATELFNRERTLLLVSHTNAAVDQALLKVADQVGEEALDAGHVLRLGSSKDERVRNNERLLMETHVKRRSEKLVAERDELQAEETKRSQRLTEIQELLAMLEWLAETRGKIGWFEASLRAVEQLAREVDRIAGERTELDDQLSTLKEELAEAKMAVERFPDWEEAVRDHAITQSQLDAAERTLAATREVYEYEQALLRDVEEHGTKLASAHKRVTEIERTIGSREPLIETSRRELADLEAALTRGNLVLAETEASGGIARRLKRLPAPETQRASIAGLVERRDRLNEAIETSVQANLALQPEYAESVEYIERWKHLPALNDQATVAGDALWEFDKALGKRDELSGLLDGLVFRVRVGDPLAALRAKFNREARDVLSLGESLAAQRDDLVKQEKAVRAEHAHVRDEVTDGLETAIFGAHRAGVLDEFPNDRREQLRVTRKAVAVAEERSAGVRPNDLSREANETRARLGVIAHRLEEIFRDIEEVELAVIRDARIVATTLTRAYQRDTVQSRRFDTVILDEASMAPIPALWVAASLSDVSLVVVGDFKQLPPIKHATDELAEKWLGRDIFDAAGLVELHKHKTTPDFFVQLREQRRMHPRISRIANTLVYEHDLYDAPEVSQADGRYLDGWFNYEWGADQPVLLVDTSGLNAWVTTVTNAGRSSRLNFLSASISVDIARLMLRDDRSEFQPGEEARIMIGAPYRPHAKLVGLFLRHAELAGEVVAGTAHTFQGHEAPVVIFDLVNDEPHWRVGMFMQDERNQGAMKRLLNVALTRAQRRLVLVGDFEWLGKRAHRNSFLAQLLADLRANYPMVPASSLLPVGLAARTAEALHSTLVTPLDKTEGDVVVTQEHFFPMLAADLARATERVVIYSPFMTPDRITHLEPELRALAERGVAVSVVTKQLEERDKNFRAGHTRMEQALRDWGVLIVHKRAMHEKLVIVDRRIVWMGSLNPLSFKNTQEIMLRRDGENIAEEIEKLLLIDDLLQPVRDGETECPYCGSEVVAAEGGHDLFYWRCVQEDCFTRSVGDPMPKDGLIVCRSGGCGATVHFGHWGEKPAWRCEVSPLHRTPIARSHLRLPKMRALIPAAELRKLEKEWGVTDEQLKLPPDAASHQKVPASNVSGSGAHEAVATGRASQDSGSSISMASASSTSSAAPSSGSAGQSAAARESRGTVEIGFINRNRQQVFAATDLPGTDHGQRIYVLCCRYCGTDYGSNGSDIFQRRCPNCQDGRPGLKYK